MSKLVSLKLYQSIFLKEQIRLRFSVDLDFSDSEKKSIIYYSWRTENNVPTFWPQLHSQIQELRKSKSIFRLTDMTLVNNKEGSFMDLTIEDFRDYVSVIQKIREIFYSDCFANSEI